jgi:putative tryptophan/tyrosine transport system substrate-binding protein
MAARIRRRDFIGTLGGAAAWPLAAHAQQGTTTPQVGILDPGIPQHFEAFRRGMRDLGYLEGRSISYMYRSAAGRAETVPQFASELVALKPDVIFAASAVPVDALKEVTSTIPIVFVLADAINAGVVSNLAHPGGNLTGLSFLNTELSAKRLGLLVETLPNIRRIAVLRDLNTPRIWAEATEEASRRLGLGFLLVRSRRARDVRERVRSRRKRSHRGARCSLICIL